MFDSKHINLAIHSIPALLEGAWVTLQLAGCSLAVGILLGIALGVLNCRRLRHPFWGFLIDAYVMVLRGTPLFVQVLIIYFALPEMTGINLSPFTAGVIAMAFNSTAYMAEIARCGINSISDGQWEASYVLGYGRVKAVRSIILPQMFQNILPALTNEFVSLIKETSVLMFIGVAELTKASRDIVARELDPMTIYLAAAVLYFVMTTAVSLVTKKLEKRAST